MKLVVQKHPMGCGIACVASLAGVSYDKAISLVDKKYAISRGYYCNELVKLLKKLGLEYKYEKASKKNQEHIQESGSIVFIKRDKSYPYGHFLLKTKKGWMNPWINFPIMAPAKAGYNKNLPGKAEWIIIKK